MTGRPVHLVAAACLAVALAGCGSDDDPTVAAPSAPATELTESTEPTSPVNPAAECASAEPTAPAPEGISEDLGERPQVAVSEGQPPCGLVVSDVVEGTGEAARPGQTLAVKYVGALFGTGQEFDASWDGGDDNTFPFELGAGNVIQGWDEGLVGMKVGGRRVLTIPPDLGYGEQGTPDGAIPPGATLVFVVDLVAIQ